MKSSIEGPRKRLLALDTATATLGVAVTENGQAVHEINASGERNHSVHLLPIVGEALRQSGGAGRLDGVAVGLGPGSYTGTRIAVTAAKSLAWGLKLPVFGVSTLQALAWGGWNAAGRADAGPETAPGSPAAGADWIIPLLDARRGQVYTALFASAEIGPPSRLADDRIRLMSDWRKSLAERLAEAKSRGEAPRRLLFIGETAVHGSAESLQALEGLADLLALPYELEGRWIGFLGEARALEGKSDDVHTLIPNYTQLAEAEANLLKSGKGGVNPK